MKMKYWEVSQHAIHENNQSNCRFPSTFVPVPRVARQAFFSAHRSMEKQSSSDQPTCQRSLITSSILFNPINQCRASHRVSTDFSRVLMCETQERILLQIEFLAYLNIDFPRDDDDESPH